MKKLIALLLLLPALLCAACSKDAESSVSAPAPTKKPLALTLEPANDLLPEYVRERWLIDDTLMVMRHSGVWKLLNLTTGETTPLTRAEDFIPVSDTEKRFSGELQWLGGPQAKYLRVVEGTGYALSRTDSYTRLVNMETGKVHSAVPVGEYGRSGVTPADNVFIAGKYELKIYAFDGTVLHTLQLEEAQGRILGVLPYEGGFAILSGAEIETHSEPMGAVTALHFTYDAYLTLTDERLRVQSVQRLGTLPMANRVCSMYHLVGSCFLICPDDCNGLLLVDRTGIRHVMLAQDGQLVVVPYEDTPDILDAMLNTRVNLWGVLKDKSYALFFLHLEGQEGLYSLNLRTLEITLQMTLAELEALSPDTDWDSRTVYWPGGEYLTDGCASTAYGSVENLYRIVEKTEAE